jgi:hypothetical protein
LYTFAAIVESMEESTVVAVLLLHVHWEVYFNGPEVQNFNMKLNIL